MYQATKRNKQIYIYIYIPNIGELRSLPNGVKDEIGIDWRKVVKRVSDEIDVSKLSGTLQLLMECLALNWWRCSMNEILINAFVARINAGMMELEQVPIPYQEAVRTKLEELVYTDSKIRRGY